MDKDALTNQILDHMDNSLSKATGLPAQSGGFYKFTLYRKQVIELIDAVWKAANESTG